MVSLSDFMRRRNSRSDSSSSINKKNCTAAVVASAASSGSNTATTPHSNSVPCFPFARFSKKHRTSCSVTDEATDSTDHQCEIAAWRVDKILDGPPREEDWWVNTAPGAAAVTSDDSFDSSAECDHTAKSRLSSGEQSSLASSSNQAENSTNSSSSPDSHSHNSTTSDSNYSRRRFRNRGLETWVVARDAWRQPCEDVTHVPTRRSDPPSPAMRKRLVQRVARDRQYTLSRQMPLSEIMSVYQEIWHGDGGEC